MARTEQIKQEVWKRRADGCTGSSNSRDLYFFLLFKSCDLTEKATSGTTQTQTLCKRRQRMNSRPCQVAATSHLWAVAGSILGPVLNNSPHSLRALWWAGWALPSLQGILALPATGQVSVSTKKKKFKALKNTPCCYRMLKVLLAPTYLHMQQLLFHLSMMTTGNVSGIAGAPGTSLHEGNASIKIFSMTFLWIMHKKKIPGSNGLKFSYQHSLAVTLHSKMCEL